MVHQVLHYTAMQLCAVAVDIRDFLTSLAVLSEIGLDTYKL